jgi:hypothetical protein
LKVTLSSELFYLELDFVCIVPGFLTSCGFADFFVANSFYFMLFDLLTMGSSYLSGEEFSF